MNPILEAASSLREALVGFDASALSGTEALELFEALATTEKACGAARLLAAARAVACGAHKGHAGGTGDPVRFVARRTGTTLRQAKDALATAAALEHCPLTKDALLAGEVSLPQAETITRAAGELPGQESDLLSMAKGRDLTTLRDEVRDRRLRAIPVDELHRRQVAARRFVHFRDGLGMVRFEGALPPETGIPFVARIEREAARRYRAQRRTGAPCRFEACAADAFVALCAPRTPAGPHRTDLVIVCDLYAWRRGHAHAAEPCHLLGGGPIPVEVARALADDAFLKVVLHDGVDIQRVRHLGRRYPAELRTALDLGPAPSFPGRSCARCRSTFSLQFDHKLPVAANGETSLENLQDLCARCHADKTEHDRMAGLLGRRAKARGPGVPRPRAP